MDEKLSLLNLKGGAAVEMFNLALEKTLANIADINTTLAKRKITLELTMQPSDDRTLISYEIGVKKALAGQGNQAGSADLRIDSKGRCYGHDRVPAQQRIAFETKVVNMSDNTDK